MNTNHISDEILIAWIDKSLSKSEYRKVSNHLEDCDKCYLRYSTLLESISVGETAKLEEVPTEIRQFAKEQLDLTDFVNIPISKKMTIFDKLRQLPIFRPIPISAVLATVALLVIIFNFSNNTVSNTPFISTSKELSPVSVIIENDLLIISQSIKVNNLILITSVKGDTLLTCKISELNFVYPISKFEGHEKIKLSVITQGVSLIDTTLTL